MFFLVIHKDKIYNIPPLISAMYILRDLGHEVELITCGISEQLQMEFKKRNIGYSILPYANARNTVAKIYEYWKFKNEVKKILSSNKDRVLWIEGAYTIRALGNVIRSYQYILQISELHENSKPQLKAIGKVIKQARVVFMPEYNRTCLYQVWFGLKDRPVVLPNKPYFLPKKDELNNLKVKYAKIIEQFHRKKVILYQGYIDFDRDISGVIKAVKNLGDEFLTVIVGKDIGMLKHYREIDSNIIFVDFIPAPDYLLITSLSYIGILTYAPILMNNIYCAPNKIYEYGAYGLPMIGNDIPGLRFLESNKAGHVVDFNKSEEIERAIIDIDNSYEEFSNASTALFNKTDNREIIRKAIMSY